MLLSLRLPPFFLKISNTCTREATSSLHSCFLFQNGSKTFQGYPFTYKQTAGANSFPVTDPLFRSGLMCSKVNRLLLMIWCFASLSTSFKSYLDYESVIMKGSVQ